MRTHRPLVLAATTAVLAAAFAVAAVPADATTLPCASTAVITARSGTGYVKWFGAEAPNGAKFSGSTLRRNHFYEVHGLVVTATFGGDVYKLSRNAVFLLSCAATAAGQPAKMTNLVMLRGLASVRTTHTNAGSVQTEEGLFGPIPGSAAMTYTLTRTMKQTAAPTFTQEMEWYHNTIHQPIGSSVAARTGTPKVNVTPYVGPSIGTCRHVVSATLVSTAFQKGTATYHF